MLLSAQKEIGWRKWVAGKALPLALCTLIAIAIGRNVLDDVSGLASEAVLLYPILGLARHVLTLAFVLLIAFSYLTRSRVVTSARGFWERVFPILVLVAGPVGVALLGRQEMPRRLNLAAVGLILSLSGASVSVWALRHLRTSFSIMAEGRRPITSGPYRHIRHPLYLGEALMMLGLCLMIGTVAAALFWSAYSVLQLVRARVEEEKLSRQFKEYRDYKARTRFIIPGLY